MNKNYKTDQNVLIYDKKKIYIYFIVRVCTSKKKKIVRFVRFFVKIYGFMPGFFFKAFEFKNLRI